MLLIRGPKGDGGTSLVSWNGKVLQILNEMFSLGCPQEPGAYPQPVWLRGPAKQDAFRRYGLGPGAD